MVLTTPKVEHMESTSISVRLNMTVTIRNSQLVEVVKRYIGNLEATLMDFEEMRLDSDGQIELRSNYEYTTSHINTRTHTEESPY
jgi:hypothetical protein